MGYGMENGAATVVWSSFFWVISTRRRFKLGRFSISTVEFSF
jgi:hypothetical protein